MQKSLSLNSVVQVVDEQGADNDTLDVRGLYSKTRPARQPVAGEQKKLRYKNKRGREGKGNIPN